MGAPQASKIVRRPTLLTDSIVMQPNQSIIPKLWAIVYMTGNAVIELALQRLLFEAHIPVMGILAAAAMASPSRDESTRQLFWNFYDEVRKQPEVLNYFLRNPDNDHWDGKAGGNIWRHDFSRLLGNEVEDAVRTHAFINPPLSLISIHSLLRVQNF